MLERWPKEWPLKYRVKAEYVTCRDKLNIVKEMWDVVTPRLLLKRIKKYIENQEISLEVSRCWEQQLNLLKKLFGDNDFGLRDNLLFHGTGVKKYEGEKYDDQKSGENDRTIRVLEEILKNGLVPHHDPWMPTGDMHSISLTNNYFYADYYADKYNEAENEVEWRYGDPNDWVIFFCADTARHEAKKSVVKKIKGERVFDERMEAIRRERWQKNQNRLYNWISSLKHNATPQTPPKELMFSRTDINDNWGVILCFDKTDVQTLEIPFFESHEVRTDQHISSLNIKAIGVPMKRIVEIRKMLE
jgi:hypothetical protein